MGFEEGNLGCPGSIAGICRTPGAQKVSAKRVCARFSAPMDWQNRAIVIAELLARVIAAIRIASIHDIGSHMPPKHAQKLVFIILAFAALRAIRITRLAFVGVTSVPRATAEWPARVDRVR